jgi:secreted Zn-dependent insulinase-like peptidase
MIESYSKFLKKLHKLKQNLETKDTEKIKRALINSLDQFFNLHGFNSPDKIDNQAEIDYIVDRIFNYT